MLLNNPGPKPSHNFKDLYKIAGISTLIIVFVIPVQLFVFIAWPPPESVLGYFILFQNNWFLGLLSLDLLYILNTVLLIFVYLGLYIALRQANQTYMLIALVLGYIGIAAYFASTVAFEMLSLSNQYSLSDTQGLKLQCLASGQAMLAQYKGTAFDVYYVLNGISVLIIASVMLRDVTFGKSTAVLGLASGVLMLIPTTAGRIGLFSGIASLIPWIVFSILIASKFFKLSHSQTDK
jgi:Domain of unknown function (DUF4386)